MPIEVRAIQERTADCEIVTDAGTLKMTYYPARVAVLDETEIERALGSTAGKPPAEQRLAVARFVLTLITAWDVERNGVPFPLDAEEIAKTLDMPFLGWCIRALYTHVMGKTDGELLKALGTVTSSQKADGKSSPDMRGAASPDVPPSSPSPSNRASRRGNLRTMRTGTRGTRPTSPREIAC